MLDLGDDSAPGKSRAQDLVPTYHADLLSNNSAQGLRNLITHAASMPARSDTSASLHVKAG
jgi:hypothetical protein